MILSGPVWVLLNIKRFSVWLYIPEGFGCLDLGCIVEGLEFVVPCLSKKGTISLEKLA